MSSVTWRRRLRSYRGYFSFFYIQRVAVEKSYVFIYVIDFWPRLLTGLLLVLQGFNSKCHKACRPFAVPLVQQEDSEQSGALTEQHCQNFSRITHFYDIMHLYPHLLFHSLTVFSHSHPYVHWTHCQVLLLLKKHTFSIVFPTFTQISHTITTLLCCPSVKPFSCPFIHPKITFSHPTFH